MPIGPVQLLVLGFNEPDFRDQVVEELERLRESRTVRVIDSLAVLKDAAGEIQVQDLSELWDEPAGQHGRIVGALVGLAVDGEDDLDLVTAAGADATAAAVDLFVEEDGWDVLQDIPEDTAAALVLIEHNWVVPLRDAVMRAGGFRISDGFISPLDLVEVGLVSVEDAAALHAIETGPEAR